MIDARGALCNVRAIVDDCVAALDDLDKAFTHAEALARKKVAANPWRPRQPAAA